MNSGGQQLHRTPDGLARGYFAPLGPLEQSRDQSAKNRPGNATK